MPYQLDQANRLNQNLHPLTKPCLLLTGATLLIPTSVLAGVSQLWNSSQSHHSCVVTDTGGVKCWGYNYYGQLGDNTVTYRTGPVDVKDSAGTGLLTNVTALALGRYHSCALLADGTVKCWGNNYEDQLGEGGTASYHYLPVAVKDSTGTAPLTGVNALAAGHLYTCALMTNTQVKCWGDNPYGQLGDGTNTRRQLPVDVKDSAGTGLLTGVMAISGGTWHVCALMNDSGVKCWGDNLESQLGDNNAPIDSWIPVDVKDSTGIIALTGVTAISAGYYYNCALMNNSGIKCWGDNPYGQLGDGTESEHDLPADVKDSAGTGPLTGVTAIKIGLGHSCALLTGGGVKCWGRNPEGQLGDQTTNERWLPVNVKDLAGTGTLGDVISIATGLYHSCALLGSGGGTSETSRVYCWGYNAEGRLGDNTATSRLIPVIVNDTAPTATSVTINLAPSGTPTWSVGETLIGDYLYTDADGEVEGSSLFKWYRATNATCTTGKTTIAGATSQTYTLTSSEEGKYVCFEVTPVASLGVSPGIVALATSSAPIKVTQIITFVLPASATIGDAPLTLTATGGASGNPVTFASITSGVCTVSGTTLTLVSAGTCTVTADQAGNANYNAASQVIRELTINLITQTITFTLPTSATVGDPPLTLTATGGASGNPVTFASTTSDVCTISGTTLTLVRPGFCTVAADQAGNANYNAAPQVVQNLMVNPPPVEVPPPIPSPRTLHITLAGTGQGSVISQPEGLDCSATSCALTFDHPQWVYLTTTPATGSVFVGWTGDPACTQEEPGKVLLLQDTSCTATFNLKIHTLTVVRNAPGVTVIGDGIHCQDTPQGFGNVEEVGEANLTTCQATYPYGTTVKLKASPVTLEWEWVGWKGACDSQGQVVMTQDRTCQARYLEDPNIPNGIDGNGDGEMDPHQPHILSLADKVTGSYITLAVNPECVVADGATIMADTLADYDPNHSAPQGLMYFELRCSQTPVTMYFHGVTQVPRNVELLKYGPTTPGDENTMGWYQLPNIKFGLATVGGKPVATVTYFLIDGQLGDNTGVDGRIVDPAGLGLK